MTTTPPPLTIQQIRDFRDRVVRWDPADSETESIDRLRVLEDLTSAVSAAQARETAAVEHLRLTTEQHRGIAKARRGKGLAAEIGLARRQPHARGSQYLQAARALTTDLPNTFEALCAGRIREEHALKVVSETGTLSGRHRKMVDAAIADRFDGLGPRQLGDEVRAHVQRIDPKGAAKRTAHAQQQRRVTVRSASDGMGMLSALLPLEQAVAAGQSLHRKADRVLQARRDSAKHPDGIRRTRDQIAADILVQRLTGQAKANAVDAEILVVMTDTAFFGADETPAWLPGHGPIPVGRAQRWLADPEANIMLRRLFTRPEDGQLMGMDSRSRDFPARLRQLIVLRDQMCRTPYCEAAIRHIDHIVPARDGGATSWENASGLCAACNQTKENTGWQHTGNPAQLTVRTPTGHTYDRTTGPPVPGHPRAARPPP